MVLWRFWTEAADSSRLPVSAACGETQRQIGVSRHARPPLGRAYRPHNNTHSGSKGQLQRGTLLNRWTAFKTWSSLLQTHRYIFKFDPRCSSHFLMSVTPACCIYFFIDHKSALLIRRTCFLFVCIIYFLCIDWCDCSLIKLFWILAEMWFVILEMMKIEHRAKRKTTKRPDSWEPISTQEASRYNVCVLASPWHPDYIHHILKHVDPFLLSLPASAIAVRTEWKQLFRYRTHSMWKDVCLVSLKPNSMASPIPFPQYTCEEQEMAWMLSNVCRWAASSPGWLQQSEAAQMF